jgi:two-component system, cell cycle response regulator DivK
MAAADRTDVDPLVLIVEDDQSTRIMYREYLMRSGFRTADAHNGFQALEKARELHPDAVLTDLAVPGMDGFEFCRALRESAETNNIPILAITGHPEYLSDPERIRHAGIADVLTKPCDPERIVRELRRLLNGHPTDDRGDPLDPVTEPN